MIELIPKTRKGENIVFNHGKTWEIIATADNVRFSDIPGTWLLIHSIIDTDMRWVHAQHDDNFSVVNKE